MELKLLLVLCGVLLSLGQAQSESGEHGGYQRVGERRQTYSGEQTQDQTVVKDGHNWGEKYKTESIQRDGQDWSDIGVEEMIKIAREQSGERDERHSESDASDEQMSSEEKVMYGRRYPRDKVAIKAAHAEKRHAKRCDKKDKRHEKKLLKKKLHRHAV